MQVNKLNEILPSKFEFEVDLEVGIYNLSVDEQVKKKRRRKEKRENSQRLIKGMWSWTVWCGIRVFGSGRQGNLFVVFNLSNAFDNRRSQGKNHETISYVRVYVDKKTLMGS